MSEVASRPVGLLATLDNLLEGCQVLDRSLRYVYLNDAAVVHARLRREELLGRRMPECYPGIEGTPFFAALGRCLESGTPQKMDNEFTYPDGSRAWFELSIQPQPLGVTILSIDVTERKRAEEALRRERDTLQRIAESSPVGIVQLDRDGRIVFANARAEDILGLPRDEITRRAYNTPAWHITDVEGHALRDQDLPFAQVRDSGQPVEGVRHAFQADDGRQVLLSINAAPLTSAGAFVGMVATLDDVTERTRALEEQRESEARFRQITEHVEEVFWMTDPAKREMLYVSPAYDRIWGRSPSSLYANPAAWLEAIHADDRERVRASLGKQPYGTYDELYRIVRPDGSTRWIRDRAFPVRDQAGRVYRVAGVAEDVTQQREAAAALQRSEDALRASEAQLRSFVEQAPADIAMFDRAMVCLAASGRWVSDWGRGRSSLVGLSHYDVHPDLPERWKEIHRRGLAGELLKSEKDAWMQADGTVRLVRWLVQPWRDPRGEIGGIMILADDITERDRAERRLRMQHEVTRVLAEAASLAEAAPRVIRAVCETAGALFGALWDVDRQANVLRCAALWRHEDLPGDEMAEQTRALTFAPGVGLPGRVWSSRRPLALADIASDPNFSRAAVAGRAGLCAALGVPILVKDEVAGVIDFEGAEMPTPDDDLLDALAAVGIQVGQFIEHRRAEAQFIQSQKMDAVGQLAGGIAHDFNNLLGVIVAYAEMAQRELGDHRASRRLAAIQTAGQRAAALTRQILAFSRKNPVRPGVCDLARVVEDMEKMLRRLIGEDIGLTVVPGPELGHVRADPSQLEQVILNLAVNARDAMPAGGSMVIETANVSIDITPPDSPFLLHPGPYVMLTVSDTGHGMSPETLAHIYEPFFTTKEQGQGTGLGLAVVYGVVRQSGGGISVFSEVGRGTTFRIYFPRVDAAETASEPAGAAATGGSETILLVEDEEALRAVVEEMLRLAGYQVLSAGDVKAALALADRAGRGGIDLVITDVVLPGLSGPAAAVAVRAGHPGARVLLVSGYTDRLEEGQRGIEAGTPFLPKPFTTDVLLRKVREVLDAPAPEPSGG